MFGSSGGGPLRSGSATVSSVEELSGVILFRSSSGVAGVASSDPVTSFVRPVQTDEGIMNLGEEQTGELELRDDQGTVVTRAMLDLVEQGQTCEIHSRAALGRST